MMVVVVEEAEPKAVVVDNMIRNIHTTHNSINICQLLHLLDKVVYHLLQ